jgi:hypothetical protein
MNAAPPALESLPDQFMATIMRLLISASLAIVAFVTIMAVDSDNANAVVCARGVCRAGCVSAGGAAGVGVRGVAVVGAGGAAVVRRPIARTRREVVVR